MFIDERDPELFARILWTAAAALCAVGIGGAAIASTPALLSGVDYIRSTQQPDGGFGGFGPGHSYDAVFAIRSAGVDPNTITNGAKSPADFLQANAAVAADPGTAAKAALAAVALGMDPANVAGVDLTEVITSAFDSATGRYAADDFSQSLAILGLQCTGGAADAGALTALRGAQLPDGGWGFGGVSDPDTTALAVQALIAAGATSDDPDIAEALAYFEASQGLDAGWGFDPSASNANSTAYVIQALVAVGIDPNGNAWAVDGVTPLTFLASQQQADGSFPGFDPAFATNQSLPALAGRTFCNAPVTPLQHVETPTPVVTSTPTGVASPPPATLTPTRVAPAPPNTGTGTGGESARMPVAVVLVILAAVGAVAAVSATACRA